MRLLALAAVMTLGATPLAADRELACSARVPHAASATIHWTTTSAADAILLEAWCRAVGPPVYVPAPVRAAAVAPALDELVVVTWNAHLAEGRLAELVAAMRSGALTGQPVRHFVLLVQEIVRHGAEVPPFADGMRSAHAIRARDAAPGLLDRAASLGLSVLYVPSMRNGRELREDRGNAIFSTEPLSNALAIELPLQRQRRVVVGASIPVVRDGVASALRVLSVHLEPLSAPRALWFFRDPRRRQMAALLGVVAASRFEEDVAWAGTVLGGDLNTVQGGVDERAYRAARRWGRSVRDEDRRATHVLGRLDYVFFRLPDGWVGRTRRADDRFGSDHHPVIGTFHGAGVTDRGVTDRGSRIGVRP